ncbi:MAG: excisionase family DNA-binding protein [Isosphaeraceae bacterium]|nr:excisionase family DNA-binding protein [Isosphaeraceae bacterium]
MAEIYLKTQQVADALGLGVSTVKRLVDKDRIVAIRTSGKHRLISLEEARRFAKSENLPTDRLDELAASVLPDDSMDIDDETRDRLFDLLKAGKDVDAGQLIVDVHARVRNAAVLADELIHRVMARIGHNWMIGTWNIYEEHQASQIVARTIGELIRKATRTPNAPMVLGAGAPGDNATIALLLGELTLREAGCEVRNLGPNLPFDSLTEAVESYNPAMVFLTVCHLCKSVAEFQREYLRFHEAARSRGVAVVLGGRALGPELRSILPYTSFGDRMSHLHEFGRHLAATRATNSVSVDVG